MQSETSHGNERRTRSQHLIRDLVDLRKEMLALYSQLAARKPFVDDDDLPELLQDFCETLIDYTANAHFRLYRHLEERQERRRAVLALAEQIYPRIAQTTQYIVDFNDRYEGDVPQTPPKQLENDLSGLGEELAERIELEDQLIEALCAPRARGHSAPQPHP
ncbi:MAG: Rsd/AlgQ family anti-sigma factor [Gammaproteobacteria bacterium]